MNKIYTLTVILTCFIYCICSSSLQAQSTDNKKPEALNLSLHLRPAFNSHFEGKPLKYDDASFRFEHVNVDITGQITPKLTYRYLQRLNKATPVFSTENLPSSIDYAYLKYKFNDHFSVAAGKQALLIGGFEYNKYPVDVYDYSGTTNFITCYLTGVQVAYTPTKNQEFIFQILNNRMGTWEEAVGKPYATSNLESPTLPLYYSIGWNSSYFDDALQLRYAANFTTPAKDKKLFMVTGGQKWQSGDFSVYIDAFYQHSEVDYLGAIRNMTDSSDNIAEYVNYFSVLGEINYKLSPKWNILLKCFYNNYSTYKPSINLDEGNCLTSLNYQAGIEYYPMEDDNLHLFLITTLKDYQEPVVRQINTPNNTCRISAGFIYRIPVISL